MSDYKELLEFSKRAADNWRGDHTFYQAGLLIDSLREAVETLMSERKVAVDGLRGDCFQCVWIEEEDRSHCCECTHCTGNLYDESFWQWCGLEGDTNGKE